MTNRLLILFREYPGDTAWAEFSASFPELESDILEIKGIKCDIARVLYWKKGNNPRRVVEWLSKPIPALDGIAPKRLLDFEGGERMLRTLIMRMP